MAIIEATAIVSGCPSTTASNRSPTRNWSLPSSEPSAIESSTSGFSISIPILSKCANIAAMLIVPLFPGSILSKICFTIQLGIIVPVCILVKAANSAASTAPLPSGSIKATISFAFIPEDLSHVSTSSILLIRFPTLFSDFFASSRFAAIATPVAVIAPPAATAVSAPLIILFPAWESLILFTIISRFEVPMPRLVENDFNSFVLKEPRSPLVFCKADMTSGEMFICSVISLALASIASASIFSSQPQLPLASSAQVSPPKGSVFTASSLVFTA